MTSPQGGEAAPQERVHFIEHQGKRILYHDFTGFTNPADALTAIAQSKVIVAAQPLQSLLTLTWVKGSRFNGAVIEAMRDLGIHNRPYVRHAAIGGLSRLQYIVYLTTSQLTGRKLHTFDQIEAAKDWLVTQP